MYLFFVGLICFLGKSYNKKSQIKDHYELLVLHENGAVDCRKGSCFTLGTNSRVGWLGCWLLLKKEKLTASNGFAEKQLSLFFFKDSMSSQDYVRLCRHINRK